MVLLMFPSELRAFPLELKKEEIQTVFWVLKVLVLFASQQQEMKLITETKTLRYSQWEAAGWSRSSRCPVRSGLVRLVTGSGETAGIRKRKLEAQSQELLMNPKMFSVNKGQRSFNKVFK